MEPTWIVVAHRGGARLFVSNGRGKGLNLVQDIPHPEGRLKNKDIGTDNRDAVSITAAGAMLSPMNRNPKHTSPNNSPNSSPSCSKAGVSSIAIRS